MAGAIHAMLLGSGGYTNLRSVSMTSASSHTMTKGQNASLDRQKFTISYWMKRSTTGVIHIPYGDRNTNAGSVSTCYCGMAAPGNFFAFDFSSNALVLNKQSSATITDTTTWHHYLVGFDTTQATAADRVRMYLDGTEITSFGVNTIPAQNTNLDVRQAVRTVASWYLATYADMLLDELYYVNGQQLTPSSFITGTPGKPKKYFGLYDAHSSYYNFEDAASTTTMGVDRWNADNFTLNNMTTSNSSTDRP